MKRSWNSPVTHPTFVVLTQAFLLLSRMILSKETSPCPWKVRSLCQIWGPWQSRGRAHPWIRSLERLAGQFIVPRVGGRGVLTGHNPRRDPASFQVVSFTMTLALSLQKPLPATGLREAKWRGVVGHLLPAHPRQLILIFPVVFPLSRSQNQGPGWPKKQCGCPFSKSWTRQGFSCVCCSSFQTEIQSIIKCIFLIKPIVILLIGALKVRYKM